MAEDRFHFDVCGTHRALRERAFACMSRELTTTRHSMRERGFGSVLSTHVTYVCSSWKKEKEQAHVNGPLNFRYMQNEVW